MPAQCRRNAGAMQAQWKRNAGAMQPPLSVPADQGTTPPTLLGVLVFSELPFALHPGINVLFIFLFGFLFNLVKILIFLFFLTFSFPFALGGFALGCRGTITTIMPGGSTPPFYSFAYLLSRLLRAGRKGDPQTKCCGNNG